MPCLVAEGRRILVAFHASPPIFGSAGSLLSVTVSGYFGTGFWGFELGVGSGLAWFWRKMPHLDAKMAHFLFKMRHFGLKMAHFLFKMPHFGFKMAHFPFKMRRFG